MDKNKIEHIDSKKGCSVEISTKYTNYSKQGSDKKETNTAINLVSIKKKQANS